MINILLTLLGIIVLTFVLFFATLVICIASVSIGVAKKETEAISPGMVYDMMEFEDYLSSKYPDYVWD